MRNYLSDEISKTLCVTITLLLVLSFILWVTHKVPTLWIFLLVLVPVLILGLRIIPKWQIQNLVSRTGGVELFKAENEARKTLAQIIGGIVILLGIYFTWQTLKVENEAQVTQRFTHAVDQLGSQTSDGEAVIEVRLGGIYALERIAKDYKTHHWQIMELLTAYVRKNATWKSRNQDQTNKVQSVDECPTGTKAWYKEEIKRPKPDIQAILDVIGRRTRVKEKDRIYIII